jgi:hypothetical protein
VSKIDAQDYLLVIGVAFLEGGVWEIYRPAALILGGLLCLGFVLLIQRVKHGPDKP